MSLFYLIKLSNNYLFFIAVNVITAELQNALFGDYENKDSTKELVDEEYYGIAMH